MFSLVNSAFLITTLEENAMAFHFLSDRRDLYLGLVGVVCCWFRDSRDDGNGAPSPVVLKPLDGIPKLLSSTATHNPAYGIVD